MCMTLLFLLCFAIVTIFPSLAGESDIHFVGDEAIYDLNYTQVKKNNSLVKSSAR